MITPETALDESELAIIAEIERLVAAAAKDPVTPVTVSTPVLFYMVRQMVELEDRLSSLELRRDKLMRTIWRRVCRVYAVYPAPFHDGVSREALASIINAYGGPRFHSAREVRDCLTWAVDRGYGYFGNSEAGYSCFYMTLKPNPPTSKAPQHVRRSRALRAETRKNRPKVQ